MPARNARHGKLFTWGGAINLKNEKYKLDERPIDERCDCPTCRMQIRHGTQTDPVHPIEVLAKAYK